MKLIPEHTYESSQLIAHDKIVMVLTINGNFPVVNWLSVFVQNRVVVLWSQADFTGHDVD